MQAFEVPKRSLFNRVLHATDGHVRDARRGGVYAVGGRVARRGVPVVTSSVKSSSIEFPFTRDFPRVFDERPLALQRAGEPGDPCLRAELEPTPDVVLRRMAADREPTLRGRGAFAALAFHRVVDARQFCLDAVAPV